MSEAIAASQVTAALIDYISAGAIAGVGAIALSALAVVLWGRS